MFLVEEVRAIEEAIFASGVSEEELLERAGLALAKEFVEEVPERGEVWVCFGSGHNGGDALVAARYLREWGWRVELVGVCERESWAPLTVASYEKLGAPEVKTSLGGCDGRKVVVMDGLLGIGSRAGLSGELAHLAGAMEVLRREGAWVVAVDLPSGMDGDTGETGGCAVVADVTITMGTPKRGLVADGAEDFVGRLALAELEGFPLGGEEWLVTGGRVRELLGRRRYSQYKTQSGRVGILAGSVEYP
ncbi:MAG: NAD(P)H-hydrate epimerase, partial [Verrucomicrobiota bacterium]